MEQEPLGNQQQIQTVCDLSMGDNNNVAFTQTQIIQISAESVKTRELISSSPYKGLEPFKLKDKDLFFGRDELITWLDKKIDNNNLILLLGASGSGKSSVVSAGLIPLLQRKRGERFCDFTLKPDEDPFESLRISLVNEGDYSQKEAEIALEGKSDTLINVVRSLKKSESKWLIFVDQFEKLFTTCPEEKCKKFIEGIVKLAKSKDDSVKIILAMRSDFLENLILDHPNLWQIVRENTDPVKEMQDDELRLAIEQPAAKNGVVFEQGLVEDIIKDVRGQAGSLPLLQYTLNLLWEQEDITGRTLHTSKYRQLGGVRGALQKRVSEIYKAFTEAEKVAVKQIFLKLVDIGWSVKDAVAVDTVVSRRAYLSEFTDDTVKRILKKLIDEHKLLISDDRERKQQPTVELAHESLINSWKELKEWIEDSKEALVIRNRLADDARRWKNKLQDNKIKAEDELWSGSRLERVLELRQEKLFEQKLFNGLSDDENQFIDASVELRDRLQAEKVRLQRRAISWLSGGLTAALIATGVATFLWQRSERQRLITEIDGLAIGATGQFESGGGEIESLLSAMESGQKLKNLVGDQPLPNYPTVSSLYALQKIVDKVHEKNQLKDYIYQASNASFSPDGQRIVTVESPGILRFYDLSGKPVAKVVNELPVLGLIKNMSFSPDGKQVTIAGMHKTVITISSYDLLGKLISKQSLKIDKNKSILKATFSRNKRYIAIITGGGEASLWNAYGKKVASLNPPRQKEENISFKVKNDADAETLQALKKNRQLARDIARNLANEPVSAISFSPNGQQIATAGDGTVRLWNLQGQPLSYFKTPHKITWIISFSPDGKQIVTSGDNGTVAVWSLSGQKVTEFNGGQGSVNDVSFSPDGQAIITAGENGTIQIWNLSGQKLEQLNGHQGSVNSVSFSPDGQKMISTGKDLTVRLWAWIPLREQATQLQSHRTTITRLSFSPDGKRISTAGADGVVRFSNLSGEPISQFESGQLHKSSILYLSSNGQRIVTFGFQDNTLKLWNLAGKKIADLKGKQDWYNLIFTNIGGDAALSPNGQHLVTLGTDKILRLWDFSRQQVIPLNKLGMVALLKFSPDGQKFVAVDLYKRDVQIWNLFGQRLNHWGGIEGSSQISSEVSGVGVQLSLDVETKTPVVTDTIQNSPAQRGDIRRGDHILAVDGKSTLGMTLEKVTNLIKGAVGTTVTLRIARQGYEEFDRPLKRTKVSSAPTPEQAAKAYESAFFSSDSQRIATTGVSDNTVRLWSLDGKPLMKLEGHRSKVIQVLFSPDDQFIATVGLDKSVRLWNASGKTIAELKGHQGAVTAITFSPDSKRIATAGDDGRVRLWTLSGQQIAQYEVSNSGVTSLTFSPDGQQLLAGAADDVVLLWRIEGLNELLARGCNWLQDYTASNPNNQAGLKVCQDKFVLIEAGRNLARMGDVAGAIAKFKTALKLDPQLKLNPDTEARLLAAPALLKKGKYLVAKGEVEQGIAAYREAQKLNPKLEISANSWNVICWHGSIWGYLKGNLQEYKADVIDACDKAVAATPEDQSWNVRRSRGLARAMTGNSAGAIKDLEESKDGFQDWFVKNTPTVAKDIPVEKLFNYVNQRHRWVNALKAGKKPFTPEEIRKLLDD